MINLTTISILLISTTHPQILDIEDLSQSDQALFDKFVQKYQKKYKTQQELEFRFQIFLKNLRILKEEPTFEDSDGMVLLGSSFEASPFKSARRRPPKLFSKGINEFIDLTEEEF